MKLMKTAALALCLLAPALEAQSQGFYVAGGAGASRWTYDCGAAGCDRAPATWRVAAGYRLNAVVAFEAFRIDFGRARSSDFSTDGTLAGRGLGVQTLVGWDFGPVEAAGKIGWARMRNRFEAAPTSTYASQTVTSNEAIGGFTMAWHVTPALAIRFDADIVSVVLNGDLLGYSRGSDAVSYMLGAMLRF